MGDVQAVYGDGGADRPDTSAATAGEASYNEQRPHSALGGRTPAQCYDGEPAASEQAA